MTTSAPPKLPPFIRHHGRPTRIRLARDLRKTIKRGHPWVFADAIRPAPAGSTPGQLAELCDGSGRPVASAILDPEGSLAIRILDPNPRAKINNTWVIARLDAALALRRQVIDPETTTGWRLLFGEGDGLPGVVCDIYGDAAVIKMDGPVCAAFWDSQAIARWVVDNTGVTTVYERFRTRGETKGRALVGPAPTAPVWFTEHGVRWSADLVRGQKTGFFLDQRENRRRVGALSRGKTVLNVFGYTGGFSVCAGLGGATHVTTVDLAAPAIADAQVHWEANDLPAGAHEGIAADAFAYLDDAAQAKRTWDVVIVDPPAFATSRKAAPKAAAAYTRLMAAGARVTAPGGVLVAASCSAHVNGPQYAEVVAEGIGQARRRAALIGHFGLPPDHPAPLTCTALHYLDCLFLRLD